MVSKSPICDYVGLFRFQMAYMAYTWGGTNYLLTEMAFEVV